MNYFGYLAVFFHFEQMWLRGELRVYGAERHRRLCEIQPLPYRAPSTVCTGSIPLGKLLLQRGRILTAMGWLRASLKHKNISGIISVPLKSGPVKY